MSVLHDEKCLLVVVPPTRTNLTPPLKVAEGLLDADEEAAVAAVLCQVPAGVAAASEREGAAELAQAFVDALADADEETSEAVRAMADRLVRAWAVEWAVGGRRGCWVEEELSILRHFCLCVC